MTLAHIVQRRQSHAVLLREQESRRPAKWWDRWNPRMPSVLSLQVLRVCKLVPEENKTVPCVKAPHMGSTSETWDQFCCIYSPREAHNARRSVFNWIIGLWKKGGSGGQCFHTLLWLHIVETWAASASTPPSAPHTHTHTSNSICTIRTVTL